MRKLEICCGDLQSVKASRLGGADRVELCSGLAEGGMTPSAGFIKKAIEAAEGKIKLHVLIRPRPGDFCYDEDEKSQILDDVEYIVKEFDGVDGLVVGALCSDGQIDRELCRKIKEISKGKSLTFHRAFDLCRNPEEALEELIEIGFDRVLTSGCAPSAFEGAATLRKLNNQADGRIIILGGAGVNSGNASEILEITGLNELHASARKSVESAMTYRNAGVSMGKPGEDEYSRMTTSSGEVAALAQAIHSIPDTKN